MKCQTFGPKETHKLPPDVVLPQQTHSTNLIEIKTGREDLNNCDGVWSDTSGLCLGVRTADCAPIVFTEGNRRAVIHAGWRGLVGGIIENALELFDEPEIWIGPLLPAFEIQRDDCYQQIEVKFGDLFFDLSPPNPLLNQVGEIIEFQFLAAIRSIIPQATWDGRSTFDDPDLASWRRDKGFPRGQNITFSLIS